MSADTSRIEWDAKLLVFALLAVIWTPLVEEAFFRGAFYSEARRSCGPVVSVVAVVIAFTLFHSLDSWFHVGELGGLMGVHGRECGCHRTIPNTAHPPGTSRPRARPGRLRDGGTRVRSCVFAPAAARSIAVARVPGKQGPSNPGLA